jgi:hypothetical protein
MKPILTPAHFQTVMRCLHPDSRVHVERSARPGRREPARRFGSSSFLEDKPLTLAGFSNTSAARSNTDRNALGDCRLVSGDEVAPDEVSIFKRQGELQL